MGSRFISRRARRDLRAFGAAMTAPERPHVGGVSLPAPRIMLQDDDDDLGPHSGRDVGAEDFLFHLYRGSELLQDNRVHEAKTELENALARKPADPKGQDLLAIVYFRLGMYPRAIAIYEALVRAHPGSVTPRVNLALCYVKTGQPNLARVELEYVLATNASHARAWGYLGLTYQRLGDLEKARHAFLSGGHESMARRIEEMLGAAAPAAPDSERTAVGLAATDAAAAVDREGGLQADPSATESEAPAAGTWSAREPGRVDAPEPGPPSIGFASMPPVGAHDLSPVSIGVGPPSLGAVPSSSGSWRPSPSHGIPTMLGAPSITNGSVPPVSAPWTSPPSLDPLPAFDVRTVARDSLVVFPRESTTALHPSGFVLLRGLDGAVVRLDLVRSLSCGSSWSAAPVPRRSRGRMADEPLGGSAAPLHELGGRVEIILAPPAGHRLLPLSIDTEEPLTLRESALVGFEAHVRYECGRMAVGEGDSLALVQLRGPGSAVLATPPSLSTVEVESGRQVLLRGLSILGWVGALVPRALSASEAPGGVRGLVTFTGEGMVLVDVR